MAKDYDILQKFVKCLIENSDGTVSLRISYQGSSIVTTTPSGTTATIDWSLGLVQILDLGLASGDVTVTLSNPYLGVGMVLIIIQGATPRAITWPAAVKWAQGVTPVLSQTNDAIDTATFIYDTANYLSVHTPGYA